MRALFFFCLMTTLLGPAAAHNKSLSFSEWIWAGKTLSVSFTTPARDVTLLPEIAEEQDLSAALAAHVSNHLKLVQINTPCRLELPFEKRPARAGYIRVEGQFNCFNEAARITVHNHAFFNLASSHVHFARITMAGSKLADSEEILFTATQRGLAIRPGVDGTVDAGTNALETFENYLALGVSHILTGYDHLAFVACLILIAQTRRRAIYLVTGFTLGHSLTLAVAALGWVTPNAIVVEALIGGSIAFVAAESVFARQGKMPLLGMSLAALFFVASGLAVIFGSSVSLAVWANLILFCLCYGLAVEKPEDAARFAPLLTLIFGLIHGFGFAGLLVDIGLPTDRLLTGLFAFNLGVELGQLLVLLPVFIFGRYLLEELPKFKIKWADIAAAGLTSFGVYLFVSRLLV